MKLSVDKLKRVKAGYQLLQQPTISVGNFDNIRTLLKGIHPGIDEKLETCAETLHKIHKLHEGEFSVISVETLPEKTEEQKKRKKLILFFIVSFNDLKSEVKRVDELLSKEQAQGKQINASTWTRIFGFAKGPLGIITVIAIGLVALHLNQTEIVVSNINCDPIQPALPIGIQIPGLHIPHETIPPSGSAVIITPPLTLTVDNTSSDAIKLTVLGIHYTIPTNNPTLYLTFDGIPLTGQTTSIALGQKKHHTLALQCQ